MSTVRSFRFSKWLTISAVFSAVAGFGVQARGQSVPAVYVGDVKITGLPDDWTHHHIVFANPGTEEQALQSGHDAQWQKITNEPRYVIQQIKKNLPVQGPAAPYAEYRAWWVSQFTKAPEPINPFGFWRPRDRPLPWPIGHSEIQRDWSMTSGGTGGLLPNHFPAKYVFSATNTESCSDFIVFPTGIVGSATQATVIAYNNLYKTTCGSTVPGVLLSINTGGLANKSPVLSLDGTQVAYVQTTSSGSVTAMLTNGSVNFTVTAGTLSSSNVGSLVAGTNIPTGDTIATVTSSTTGTLTTAASGGGSHVLTITGVAQLVLLKIAAGGTSVSIPSSPGVTTHANYRACTAPCYTTFNFYNATAGTDVLDSNSAPFYVYPSGSSNPDTLYVGDDLGYVHNFSGVFEGTPAEVTTTGWPARASTEAGGVALNSPVYDTVSGYIFVGDTGGYLHQFAPAAPGTVNVSGRLGYNTGGLTDPPIVDDTSGTDYAYQFVGYSDDTTHNRPSYINVFPAETALSGTFGTSVWFPNDSTTTRPAGTSTLQYAGTFDNAYFTGTGQTGNIYTCAGGVLYQVPLANIGNATPTVRAFSTPTSAATNCSPVTEFYNGTTDYIFMSVAANGNATVTPSCSGACVYNYNVTTSTATTGSPTDGLAAPGGTSGIVIDNSASGGGSEIYFTSQSNETCGGNGSVGSGTGSCAVQATQSGLQ